jgi:hypothetical protein
MRGQLRAPPPSTRRQRVFATTHRDPKAPSVEFYVEPGSGSAVVFDEADAKAFVEMLNWYRH